VELVVEEKPWRPRTRFREEDIVKVTVAYSEQDLRIKLKAAGGIWDPEDRVWQVRYGAIRGTELEGRIVEATAEFVLRLKLTGSEGGSWYVIKGDTEYQFNVFRQRSGEVIGCLPVIVKTDVSEERWEEIWGMPRA